MIAMAAPPITCDITRIGVMRLSTCGARIRLVINPPDRINSSQRATAHEARSF